MRRLLPFVLLLSLSGCVPPASVQTPQGQAAYKADQIVVRVNELENAAIQANTTGGLSTATTRRIVQFCIDADTALKTVPQGWQAAVSAAYASLKGQLTPEEALKLAGALAAVDTVLQAVGVTP